MSDWPSTDEHLEVHELPQTESQKVIAEIKELKRQNPFATYARIIDEVGAVVDADGHRESVGMSTVRRVFAKNSESKASSFSFDHILCPIRDALKRLQEKDIGSAISPELVDALKSLILVQSEEIVLLQEQNEQLADQLAAWRDQIRRKDERMDRKDAIIAEQAKEIRELRSRVDELAAQLMGKSK